MGDQADVREWQALFITWKNPEQRSKRRTPAIITDWFSHSAGANQASIKSACDRLLGNDILTVIVRPVRMSFFDLLSGGTFQVRGKDSEFQLSRIPGKWDP